MNPTPTPPYDYTPTIDPTEAIGELIAALSGFMLVGFLLSLAFMALGVWIAYTIMWRAVRRGLYEYHNPRPTRAARDLENRVRGPRDW